MTKKRKSKPIHPERHPAADWIVVQADEAPQGSASLPERGRQVTIRSLDDSNETLQAAAVHDLAEALRYAEMQRSGLVEMMLKLDPGELAQLRHQIGQLDIPGLRLDLQHANLPEIGKQLRNLFAQVEQLEATLTDSRNFSVIEQEVVTARQRQDQAISQLMATQTQLQSVEGMLLATQAALEEHQSLLESIYISKRWRLFVWFDRLIGRGGAFTSES